MRMTHEERRKLAELIERHQLAKALATRAGNAVRLYRRRVRGRRRLRPASEARP